MVLTDCREVDWVVILSGTESGSKTNAKTRVRGDIWVF